MAEKAIINASPLLFLSRSHHLDLLQAFAGEIWVPEPVAMEILQRGQQDITARFIEQTEWLITQPVPLYQPLSLNGVWERGNQVFLPWQTNNPGTETIIDDLAGRKCAASLNISVPGTLGIVLIAKKCGLIPKA